MKELIFLTKLIKFADKIIEDNKDKEFDLTNSKDFQLIFALGTLHYMLDILKSLNLSVTSLSGEILIRSLIDATTKGILFIDDYKFVQSFNHTFTTNQLESAKYLLNNKERFKEEVSVVDLEKDIKELENELVKNAEKSIKQDTNTRDHFDRVAIITGHEIYGNWYEEIFRQFSNTSTHLTGHALRNKYLQYSNDKSKARLLAKRHLSLTIEEIILDGSFSLILFLTELNKLIPSITSDEIEEFSKEFVELKK